ncbi:MAG: hypothetical protein H6Q00_414 [Holophagaceae bacterium]|nr:hypothetical protein [Holophagaceae bacterium]
MSNNPTMPPPLPKNPKVPPPLPGTPSPTLKVPNHVGKVKNNKGSSLSQKDAISKSKVVFIIASCLVMLVVISGAFAFIIRRKNKVIQETQDRIRQAEIGRVSAESTIPEEEKKSVVSEESMGSERPVGAPSEQDASQKVQTPEVEQVDALAVQKDKEIELAKKQFREGSIKRQPNTTKVEAKVEVKDWDVAPTFIKKPVFYYPKAAISKGADPNKEYLVSIKLYIDQSGAPTRYEVLDSPPEAFGFNEVAGSALMQSRFVAAIKGGVPCASWIVHRMRFPPQTKS